MKNFYRSNILLALVLALVICLVAMDIILFSDQPGAFWISLPPSRMFFLTDIRKA